ncbi:MAG: hypothetical protein ACPG8A_12825, partial [Psychrobium sp.]
MNCLNNKHIDSSAIFQKVNIIQNISNLSDEISNFSELFTGDHYDVLSHICHKVNLVIQHAV